jgi:hypothetical protein
MKNPPGSRTPGRIESVTPRRRALASPKPWRARRSTSGAVNMSALGLARSISSFGSDAEAPADHPQDGYPGSAPSIMHIGTDTEIDRAVLAGRARPPTKHKETEELPRARSFAVK